MLPLFYSAQLSEGINTLILDEETSRHVVQVLRMKKNEQLQLTNGKGLQSTATITDDHKKKVVVSIDECEVQPENKRKLTIAISLLKNANRFEWFLEKATEIGINVIIPVICERTERQHFRSERMQNILISAMLQSRQFWMPQLEPPTKFEEVVSASQHQQKFIAHCIEEEKKQLKDLTGQIHSSKVILIGPEGDFTFEEVSLAMNKGFIPVTLGENRLRSETAGMVAAALLKLNS